MKSCVVAMLFLVVAWSSWAQGLNWYWSNPQPNGNNIAGIAQNGDVSVEVAELGQLYMGNDFYDWLPASISTTNDFQAVAFFGSRLVAVGENGLAVYSDDYVNFTNLTLNTSGDWLVGLAVSPNLLVADGDEAVLYTSPDGAHWTSQAKPPGVGGDWLISAAWGNGTFVIGGEDGYLANGTDGVHWTNQTSASDNGIFTNGDDVTWLQYVSGSGSKTSFPFTGFWAVTDSGKAAYSTNDGVTWRQFSAINGTDVLCSVSANANTALIVGTTNLELGISTGIWNPQTGARTNSAPTWTYYDSLWDTNGDYQLAGGSGMLVQGALPNGSYGWQTFQTDYPIFYDWLLQVMVVDGLYVAVGDHARIVTSDNGADWSIEAIPKTNSISTTNTLFLGVGGDTNLLVAAGNQGSLAISPAAYFPVVQTNADGTTVTNLANAIGVLWQSLPAVTTNDFTAVGVYSNRYYLVGSSATLFSTTNGTNWVQQHVPVTNDLSGIAASTNQLVIVGDEGCILTSTNGTNWIVRTSGTTNGLFRIHWFNGLFLALGENGTLLRSTNAATWYASTTGTSNWLNDAVMVSNTCYVVGNYGLILSSTNFTNWTTVPIITADSLYGAATQNGQLVTVGLNGDILRSQVLPATTPVNIITYAQTSGDNVFLIGGVVDQQFTLDSSTNLVDWTTGPQFDLIYGDGTLEVIEPKPTNSSAADYYRCTLVP